MTSTVADLMTQDPFCISPNDTVMRAAQAMRDLDVGAVLLAEENQLYGIVTDRDIAIRAVAEGIDMEATSVGEIATNDPVTVAPDDDLDRVIAEMKDSAVRRIPVVADGRPVGILSLGDLAVERDPRSALGEISDAPPDR